MIERFEFNIEKTDSPVMRGKGKARSPAPPYSREKESGYQAPVIPEEKGWKIQLYGRGKRLRTTS